MNYKIVIQLTERGGDMRKFFTNIYQFVATNVGSVWKQMKLLQRIVALSIIGVLVIGVVLVASLSARPDRVYLFTNGINDEVLLQKISMRLDTENIVYYIDSSKRISVENKSIAQYTRAMLVREDLIPTGTDPWNLFDIQRWTQTDFERNVNLQRAITAQLEQHITALDDVDGANVTLVMPEDSLFVSDRNPVSASVILQFKPNSDFRENRKKIEGIETLILLAVEGLLVENLIISDETGIQLNDFVGLADFDSLELTKRELKIQRDYENRYKKEIISALSDIYTADRVRVVNINVEMDFSKKSEEITENFPIVVKEDNPNTPYDESEVVLSVPRSQENITEKYSGTGFNPEGPPGVEGQVPPSYKDLDGIVGSWDHNTIKINNEINQRIIIEEKRPRVFRVTASVAIDGLWTRKYDDEGKVLIKLNGQIDREYFSLSTVEIRQATSLVIGAIGFEQKRGDSVFVENIQFDRTAEFELEDIAYQKKILTRKITIYSILALFCALLFFVLVRLVSRQIELYRIKKEERLAEQYRRMREAQISAINDKEEEEEEETELQVLTRMIQGLVNDKPLEISALVRSWMEE